MNKIELIKQVQDANAAYAAGIPFISDTEYDILWQELYKIDPNNDLLYHTANRGYLTGTDWHKFPIYGTNKAFCLSDLKPFFTRFGSQEIIIEPKYDGCAVVMTATKSGWKLSLEGDGKCGQDISYKIPYIKFPSNLKHFQSMEVIIPFEDWKTEYGKNPRNTVSGWLARKHDIPTVQMTAVSHNYGELFYPYTYDGDLDSLGELLLMLHAEWSKIYPIDGLMLKVKSEKTRLVALNNGKTNNWSIAWKPPIQIKDTVVTDIEWNVSRLGRVIPTVIYEPIELCGTVNTRVTGNNAKWILEREIQIGSKISVGKAGEIIPKIISVSNQGLCPGFKNTGENFNSKTCLPVPGTVTTVQNDTPETAYFNLLPVQCPICKSYLTVSGVHLICTDEKCIAKLITSIAHFYSPQGIKLDGLGEALVEKILQDQTCYNILKDKSWALLDPVSYNIVPQLINVLGDKIFANIFDNVNNISGTKNMAHFIAGLGLPGLAYKTSLRLCQFLSSGKINIHISDKAQKSFIHAVSLYTSAISEMKNFKLTSIPSQARAIYCITGTLSKDRLAMIEYLNIHNYEYSQYITRETNYLIVGAEPGKVKIDKAIKYNIPQISEEQLFKLLNGD